MQIEKLINDAKKNNFLLFYTFYYAPKAPVLLASSCRENVIYFNEGSDSDKANNNQSVIDSSQTDSCLFNQL